jgi:hypothetical protein
MTTEWTDLQTIGSAFPMDAQWSSPRKPATLEKGWTDFQWTRLSRQFALPETFLKDSVWVYAVCRKNLVCGCP